MNHFFPAFVAASAFLCGLAAAPAVVAAESANPVEHDMALQTELYNLLQTVQDKASADAAAPRVKEIGEAMNLNIEAIMAFLKNDKAAARAAFIAMREDIDFSRISKGWVDRVAELRAMDPPCFGSSALREALKEVKSEPKKD